jgi:hypothetical protein
MYARNGHLQFRNTDKHLPKSPLTGKFFKMSTFCIVFYESYLSTGRGERGGVVKRSRRRWGRKGRSAKKKAKREKGKEEYAKTESKRRWENKRVKDRRKKVEDRLE